MNKLKMGRRLCSVLLILMMIAVMLPQGDLAAEETDAEVAAEAEAQSEQKVTEFEAAETESAESDSEEPEQQTQGMTGSISGTVWLDENEDGVYDSGEKPVADYEVSLYLSSNTNEAVAMVTTGSSGNYKFGDLEPNDYVVGIPLSQSVSGTEYLVPLIGISGDNKFALDKTTYDAYTNTITITPDSEVKDYNAGVRQPASFQTASVGIQPVSSTAYTVNSTVIGFAGYEWWVIGNSSTGVTTSNANYVTLWSKNYNFGTSQFNPSTPAASYNNNYNSSILQTSMNNWYSSLFTTAIGNTQEQSYVIQRASMDLLSETGANTWGYTAVANQNFWPLSYQEWTTVNNATVRYYGLSYWLRSPRSPYVNYAWCGAAAGSSLFDNGVNVSNAVRPAFYLNLSSVIFTSSASSASSKSNATAGSPTLEDATSWSGDSTEPIKLTMEDNSILGLTTTTTEITAPPNGTAKFQYSGAQTGTGKSVSVLIYNSAGTIVYYGRPVDTSIGNTSGEASFTVPAALTPGDYTLKVFNEQVNGNYYTDYASTPQTITLKVREVTVGLTPSTTAKVYDTDSTNTVDITAVVGNHTAVSTSTIQDVEWFRVPVSDTADYSSTFDTAITGISAANQGSITSSSGAGATYESFNLTVDQNATYWFKGTVIAGTNTYTAVESITVNNIYTTTPVSVRGEISASSPTAYLYGYEVVSGTYGIPYDLDSTTALPKVVYSTVTGYYDTVTLDAKSQYSSHWTSAMTSGTALSLTLTLNGAFLTNSECDSGDYAKYTIVYARIPSAWRTITAYYVDESGSALTSGGASSETFSAPVDASGNVSNFLSDGGRYSPPTITDYTVIGYYVGSTAGTFVSCTDFTTFDPSIPVGTTEVYIVYRANTTDLVISKTVSGKYGDPNQEFVVTITLEDSGTPVNGIYNYTSSIGGAASTTHSITFTSGLGTIKLKHDQTITIEGLPLGYTYTVEETDPAVTGIYSVTYSSTSGTAAITTSGVTDTLINTIEEVSITNSRPTVSVTGLNGTGYRVVIVSFSVVLAVAVTTLWCCRRRRKCK